MIQGKRATTKRSQTKNPQAFRYVLLDGDEIWRDRLGRDRTLLCSNLQDTLQAIKSSTKDSLWISSKRGQTDELLRSIAAILPSSRRVPVNLGNLILLEPPRPESVPALHGLFARIIGETPSFKTLPNDEFLEVVTASPDKSRDVFLGGVVDRATETLALVRGTLDWLTVPLTIFRPSGRLAPDFHRFTLDDYGHTLRFGDYEATADFVLWTMDPDYRTRLKIKERAQAQGFGPALRRLRKQRGLSQSDFPGITRKTISRIENGEIEKPHSATLNRIAQVLGVAPEDIETF